MLSSTILSSHRLPCRQTGPQAASRLDLETTVTAPVASSLSEMTMPPVLPGLSLRPLSASLAAIKRRERNARCWRLFVSSGLTRRLDLGMHRTASCTPSKP